MKKATVRSHNRSTKGKGNVTVKKHYRRSMSNQKARKKLIAPELRGVGSNGISRSAMRQALHESREELKRTGKKDMSSKVMYMADKGISGGKLKERDTLRGDLLHTTVEKRAPRKREAPKKAPAKPNPVAHKPSAKKPTAKPTGTIKATNKKVQAPKRDFSRLNKRVENFIDTTKGIYSHLTS